MNIVLLVLLTSGFSAFLGCHAYSITELTDDNWQITLFDNWMILFCSSSIPACNYFKPEYKAFARWADDYATQIAFVNFTINPGLAARFMITDVPALVHASNGVYRELEGKIATFKYRDLIKYVDFERRWTSFPEFPRYRRPNTWWMTIFSDLVYSSMGRPGQSIHQYLVTKYFLPFSLYLYMMPIYHLIVFVFYYAFVKLFLEVTNVFSATRHPTSILLSSKISNPRKHLGSIVHLSSKSSSFMSTRSIQCTPHLKSSADLLREEINRCKNWDPVIRCFRRNRKSASFSGNNSDNDKGKRHVDECFSDSDDHEPRRKSKASHSDRSTGSSRDNSAENQAHKSSSFSEFNSDNLTVDSNRFVFL